MKHGLRPTRRQKLAMQEVGLNHNNWLVAKNNNDQLLLVHRENGQSKTIPAYGGKQ
ncbi:DUF6906 family protein [Mesobacillus jeotgali]|uniref:DUF6906 family protein n=1 Tax=Mesobacillus jeotgali TaxID=129985 RepID=UPI001CFCE180|nr:hypothetical protein [Mesobacillus jeotgali]